MHAAAPSWYGSRTKFEKLAHAIFLMAKPSLTTTSYAKRGIAQSPLFTQRENWIKADLSNKKCVLTWKTTCLECHRKPEWTEKRKGLLIFMRDWDRQDICLWITFPRLSSLWHILLSVSYDTAVDGLKHWLSLCFASSNYAIKYKTLTIAWITRRVTIPLPHSEYHL